MIGSRTGFLEGVVRGGATLGRLDGAKLIGKWPPCWCEETRVFPPFEYFKE